MSRKESISLGFEDEKIYKQIYYQKFCTSVGLEPETSCGETVANDGVCSHLQINQAQAQANLSSTPNAASSSK